MAINHVLIRSKKKKLEVLLQANLLKEACVVLTEICKLDKHDVESLLKLGTVHGMLGQFSAAEASCRKALALQPNLGLAHYNLGIAQRDQGKIEEAAVSFLATIRLLPNMVQAYSDFGFACRILNKTEEAIHAFRTAVQLAPHAANAHANLAVAFYDSGAFAEAIASFHKAIQLNPNEAGFFDHLGTCYCCQGKIDDALQKHREAIKLKPNDAKIYSNFLLTLHYDPKQDPASIYTEHKRSGNLYLKSAAGPAAYANTPDPLKKLRVGYVSPDFRTHSVAYFFEPLLAQHNPAAIETFCYSNVKQPDATTRRLEALAHHWRKISSMTDTEVSDAVQADGIDILVDLAGHTGNSRLGIFAHKPAPVQISYLGYPDTTGLSTMDYRFTDNWADPLGMTEKFHTETLVRLPNGFLCYQPSAEAPLPASAPVEKTGHITFGSFNNLAKINLATIALWARILRSVPQSRLIIKNNMLTDSPTREQYYGLFEEAGLSRDRVELLGLVASHVEHLQLYNRIDIALDTFPYNGTTTTCEALWMGVPVVVLTGETHASRVGLSLLSQLDLRDYSADSADRYHDVAVALAHDTQRLTGLHATLRDRLRLSSLCNAAAFTSDVENAYRKLWTEWCSRNMTKDE